MPVEAPRQYPYNAAAQLVCPEGYLGIPAAFDEPLRAINVTTPKVSPKVRSTSRLNHQAGVGRPPILSRLILLWATLSLGAGVLLLVDTILGLSLLWGFSVSLLPGICFAWYSYRKPWGARQAAAVLSAIYRAETIKFLLTVVLFAAVFTQVDKIYPSVVFLAFIGAQICSWVLTAQALIKRQQ